MTWQGWLAVLAAAVLAATVTGPAIILVLLHRAQRRRHHPLGCACGRFIVLEDGVRYQVLGVVHGHDLCQPARETIR